ncbi:phage tail family protein (plasmid) [Bacillus carboniphilus]|uniref:Phage tail family protein n=1 Tax=Bacillus carboniphilus TaxID=86663 RepID=A0ABY9K0B9_9BACI|nr:phage tail domain-containing protein [Bacillus carboniphilus]WLR44483.1 phage tail family protein [Bacillus carboniphilus]
MNKSIFNFKIVYDDGTEVDMHDLGLWVENFRIKAPPRKHDTESLEARDGEIYLGSKIEPRKISTSFSFECDDYEEFDHFRDEIYKTFLSLQEFYIIRDLQPNKRMRVAVDGDFDIDYLTLEDGEFSINLIMFDPLLESVDEVEYKFTSSSFTLNNLSDIPIDPRKHDLTISFVGNSTGLKIKNNRTQDTWEYEGTTTTSDTLVLNGIRPEKNNQSIVHACNRKVIKLDKGENQFTISNASNFEISFNFRFKYI